jgi:hypothetical protein
MPNLPKSATYEERLIALAKRLGYKVPAQPLTDTHWITLWAWIGTELAQKEPEFSWGRGRRLGSKSRALSPSVTPAAIRKRRQRAKRRITIMDLLKRDKN